MSNKNSTVGCAISLAKISPSFGWRHVVLRNLIGFVNLEGQEPFYQYSLLRHETINISVMLTRK